MSVKGKYQQDEQLIQTFYFLLWIRLFSGDYLTYWLGDFFGVGVIFGCDCDGKGFLISDFPEQASWGKPEKKDIRKPGKYTQKNG